MKRKLAIVGALLLAAFAVWYLSGGRHARADDFVEESNSILRDLTSGPEAASSAYEAASFPFRESRLLASFVDRADRITETLGEFKEILDVEEIVQSNTIRGKAVTVEYELRFAKVETTGEVSYLRESDGKWRLLGYAIRVPLALGDKADEVDSQWDRIRAPKRVLRQVDEMLSDLASGKSAEVFAAASPPFQESTSLEGFQRMLASIESELGPFQRRLNLLKSGQNQSKTRAKVTAYLQYESARTTGTFEFIRTDDTWRLLHFKVVIPDPVLPDRRKPAR